MFSASARAEGRFVEREFRDAQGAHRYVIFVPNNFRRGQKKPAILFLHGAGERGTDGWRPTTIGLGPYVQKKAATFPHLVVFPQCETMTGRILTGWHADSPDGIRAMAILDSVRREFGTAERSILTGWSMGGHGVWSLAAAHPKRWSAIVPVSGGGDPGTASKLVGIPTWAFHGDADLVVPPDGSQSMMAALQESGGKGHLSLWDAGHDVWRSVYALPALYRWMTNPTALSDLPGQPPSDRWLAATTTTSFRPVVDVPGAAKVHLGQDLLTAVGDTLADLVPADVLRGRVNDVFDSTSVSGRAFQIQFANIRYQSQLVRARFRPSDRGTLTVNLGLTNLRMVIGNAFVTGARHSASTGAMQVVIGHRRPVWLSFTVRPRVDKRRLRLNLESTTFSIPSDNWYVTRPNGVSTRGVGMSSSRVSNGLVDGLYGSKGRIEREVAAAVPSMLKEMERQLDQFGDASELVGAIWPLPVYKPNVRVWPSAVKVTDRGIDITLGLSAESPTGATTSRKSIPGRRVTLPKRDSALQMGLSLSLVETLTGLLIREDVAQMHVLDFPGDVFAQLGDRAFLVSAIPALGEVPADQEIWSEIRLTSPMRLNVEESEESESETTRINFAIPKAELRIGPRSGSLSDWKPLVVFQFDLQQPIESQLLRPSHTRRKVQLVWVDDPSLTIQGAFVDATPSNDELEVDAIRTQLLAGWKSYTGNSQLQTARINDLMMGQSRLRLSDVAWQDGDIGVSFAVPGVKITNKTDETLVYETKQRHYAWGGPYELAPGKSHRFRSAGPLQYRRQTDGRVVRFTLRAGSHFEYRTPKSGGPAQLFTARKLLSQP